MTNAEFEFNRNCDIRHELFEAISSVAFKHHENDWDISRDEMESALEFVVEMFYEDLDMPSNYA